MAVWSNLAFRKAKYHTIPHLFWPQLVCCRKLEYPTCLCSWDISIEVGGRLTSIKSTEGRTTSHVYGYLQLLTYQQMWCLNSSNVISQCHYVTISFNTKSHCHSCQNSRELTTSCKSGIVHTLLPPFVGAAAPAPTRFTCGFGHSWLSLEGQAWEGEIHWGRQEWTPEMERHFMTMIETVFCSRRRILKVLFEDITFQDLI